MKAVLAVIVLSVMPGASLQSLGIQPGDVPSTYSVSRSSQHGSFLEMELMSHAYRTPYAHGFQDGYYVTYGSREFIGYETESWVDRYSSAAGAAWEYRTDLHSYGCCPETFRRLHVPRLADQSAFIAVPQNPPLVRVLLRVGRYSVMLAVRDGPRYDVGTAKRLARLVVQRIRLRG